MCPLIPGCASGYAATNTGIFTACTACSNSQFVVASSSGSATSCGTIVLGFIATYPATAGAAATYAQLPGYTGGTAPTTTAGTASTGGAVFFMRIPDFTAVIPI